MYKLEIIKESAKTLNLWYIKDHIREIIDNAESKDSSYQDFAIELMSAEINERNVKAKSRRLKEAAFPVIRTLEGFDLGFQKSITRKQLNRLAEMEWVDKLYNLIFLGPPGVGKSHLAIALGYQALELGYKVSFTSMDNLMHLLKTQEISRISNSRIKRIQSSHLVIIDELGYLPITKQEANMFFQLISNLQGLIFYGKDVIKRSDGSYIITQKEYVSYFGSADEFKKFVFAAAARAGYGKIKEAVVLGDGAPWIWNMCKEMFPDATQILDFYHMSENTHKYAKLIYPEDEINRKIWINKILDGLKSGEIEEVLKQVEEKKVIYEHM